MKKILIIISIFLFLSCTTSVQNEKISWSKKPMFASIDIEDVEYLLRSSENTFSEKGVFTVELVLKNTSKSRKNYKFDRSKFVKYLIRSNEKKKLTNGYIEIPPSLKEGVFSLNPEEKRVFTLKFDVPSEFDESNAGYLQIYLFFLEKQFHRNSLTIYIEKK